MSFESPIPETVLERIATTVGPRGYSRDAQEIAPHCISWRDSWQGRSPMLVKPKTTEEVANVVRICHETSTAIVPQGGNTGLTGASQPHNDGSEIILSTSRLNAMRDIDLDNDTVTVEAGYVLQNLQALASENNRLFPLSLGAQGTCQIGGNLSTNAGGTQVLRYGNTRSLVLGLEVVLPNGEIWDGLRSLRKDNTGYDLKHCFIGAEGTLGIITAAVLRLFPKPTDVQTALAGLPSVQAAIELIKLARRVFGEQVSSFELMHRRAVDITRRHIPGIVNPFEQAHEWYVLLDVSGQGEPGTLVKDLEDMLAAAFEAGNVTNATIAATGNQSIQFWAIREGIPEAQKHVGASIKHDVSIPVSSIAEFIDRAGDALEAEYPGVRPIAFGHLGDGNIHYNVSPPEDFAAGNFEDEGGAVNRIVHDLVMSFNGSISAEHGLGRLRLGESERYKSKVELELMRTLKRALDPKNIMNPGKVVRM